MDGAILQMCFMQDTSLDKVSTFTQSLHVGWVLTLSWYTFWWLENISQLSVSNNWFSHLSCVYLLFKIGWKFLPKRMQLLKWNYKCPCCMVGFRSIALKKLFYSIVNEIADNTHPRWIRTPEKLCDKMNRPGQVKTSPGILLKVILAPCRYSLSLSLSLFSNKIRYSHILYS